LALEQAALEHEDDGMNRNGDALLTASELAHLMGLRDPQQVLDLRQTSVRFPEPVCRVNRSFVWSWPEVEAWARVQAGLIVGGLGGALAAFIERLSWSTPALSPSYQR
jgi:predicted DNA-binding transcriptional regulator AlpA